MGIMVYRKSHRAKNLSFSMDLKHRKIQALKQSQKELKGLNLIKQENCKSVMEKVRKTSSKTLNVREKNIQSKKNSDLKNLKSKKLNKRMMYY